MKRPSRILTKPSAAALAALLLVMAGCAAPLLMTAGCAGPPEPAVDFISAPPPADARRADGLPSAGQYRGVTTADMDNDGRLDIIGCASSPGAVAIWYGGDGGFFRDAVFLPIKGDVRSVAVGDFNGDGRQDIVFSVRREASGIMVWLNQNGRLFSRGVSPTEGSLYEGVAVADVNNDGHADILAANTTTDAEAGIQIWLGDGQGNWPVETGPTVRGRFMDVALADLDHDGLADLVGSGWGTYDGLRVWRGDGTGNWAALAPVDEGSFYGLSISDFNGDGHPDILAGTHRRGVRIYLGDGTGRFAPLAPPTTEGSFWKVVGTDLDGDGVRDLLAGSLDDEGIRVWRRTPGAEGDWVFLHRAFPNFGTYYDIRIADINRDGHPDVFAANFGAGIKLWLGRGGYPSPPRVREVGTLDSRPGPEEVTRNAVFTTEAGFAEYRIGPGDLLKINMWKGSTGESEQILVRPDGRISFSFVEDMDVTGLTPTQLDALLTRDMKVYIRNPRIDVVVEEYRSKFVTFAGEIYTNVTFRSGPGRYPLTGRISLLEMLSKVGGPTQSANLREVHVRNADGRTFNVDLYKTINYGDRTQNPVLDDGDLVMIPAITREANRVYVFGEVAKPGVYTFTGSQMDLFDAISQAGGVTIFAREDSARIVRGDITRPEVIEADLERLIEEGDRTQNVGLINGDLVYVPRSLVGDANLFVRRISPLLQMLFIPANFRDEYMGGDAFRLP